MLKLFNLLYRCNNMAQKEFIEATSREQAELIGKAWCKKMTAAQGHNYLYLNVSSTAVAGPDILLVD